MSEEIVHVTKELYDLMEPGPGHPDSLYESYYYTVQKKTEDCGWERVYEDDVLVKFSWQFDAKAWMFLHPGEIYRIQYCQNSHEFDQRIKSKTPQTNANKLKTSIRGIIHQQQKNPADLSRTRLNRK